MLVKLFDIGPILVGKDSQNALSLLETQMNNFMIGRDIQVREVNGPHATYFPPPMKELPERVYYTASVVYELR